MADNKKAYETYQLLANMLNSQRQTDIDAAYNALKAASEASYESKIKQTEDDYSKKRDIASQNRAKADKYLNYFMTEGGFDNSGIQADAKVKQEIGFNSALSALDASENSDIASLRENQQQDSLKLEAQRADSKYEAKKDAADDALESAKTELEKEQLESENLQWQKENEDENFWKQKEFELAELQASGSDKNTDSAIKAYRQQLYNSIVSEFERAETLEQMQNLYNSISGVNTEQANTVFGETLYKELIQKFNKAISDTQKKNIYNQRVNELYDEFVKNKAEHYNTTYLRLYKEIMYGNFSKYTLEQLKDALELYRKNSK